MIHTSALVEGKKRSFWRRRKSSDFTGEPLQKREQLCSIWQVFPADVPGSRCSFYLCSQTDYTGEIKMGKRKQRGYFYIFSWLIQMADISKKRYPAVSPRKWSFLFHLLQFPIMDGSTEKCTFMAECNNNYEYGGEKAAYSNNPPQLFKAVHLCSEWEHFVTIWSHLAFTHTKFSWISRIQRFPTVVPATAAACLGFSAPEFSSRWAASQNTGPLDY